MQNRSLKTKQGKKNLCVKKGNKTQLVRRPTRDLMTGEPQHSSNDMMFTEMLGIPCVHWFYTSHSLEYSLSTLNLVKDN